MTVFTFDTQKIVWKLQDSGGTKAQAANLAEVVVRIDGLPVRGLEGPAAPHRYDLDLKRRLDQRG